MDSSALKLEAALKAKLGWAHCHNGSKGRVFIDTVCPRCHKRKLSVNAGTGFYKCWRECPGGHVRELLGADFKFTGAVGRVEPEGPAKFVSPGSMISLTDLPPDHHAIQYLVKERKFNPEYLQRVFGAAYCYEGEYFGRIEGSDAGRYNTTDTLLFPMRRDGKLVGWQSRLLYDPDKLSEAECFAKGMVADPEDGKLVRFAKYWTMPGMSKGTILFNYDNALKSDVVAVTEGVFDTAGVGECAVATLGKGVSEEQQSMLAQKWKLAILLLDPDAEAKNIMLKAALNRQGMPAVCVKLENDEDAGETPRLEIWRQVMEACEKMGVNLSDYNITIGEDPHPIQ
jgi:hypothetical protein